MSMQKSLIKVAIGLLAGIVLLLAGLPSLVTDLRAASSQQSAIGAISGVVFFDSDGDGVQDLGPEPENNEPGIAAVTLQVRDAATNGLVFSASTTSDGNGVYSFSGLAPDTYLVVQSNPEGFLSTTPDSISVSVETMPVGGVDFGDVLPLFINGTVFNDLDQDGFQAFTEPGTADALIEVFDDANTNGLVDSGEVLLGSAVSDATGNYVISDILPGTRVVRIRPPGGASAPGSDVVPLTLLSTETGGAYRVVDFPLIETPEPTFLCSVDSLVDSKFKNGDIPGNTKIWFSARMQVSGLGTIPTVVVFDRSEVVFSVAGVPYQVTLPAGQVTFSPSAASTTTTFDAAQQMWRTTVSPGNNGRNVFVTGVAFAVPVAGLPGKIKPVTWTGRFNTDTPGLSIKWEWAAAVYSNFSTNYATLGVKPVDGSTQNPYANNDNAGAPQSYKAFVIDGATGGVGNYTGKFSGAGHAAPCADPNEIPYLVRVNNGGVTYTDSLGRVWSADKGYKVGSWGYSGGAAKSSNSSVDGTVDDALFQKSREKPGEYRFTLPAGEYSVILSFAEFQASNATDRQMRITLEGVTVESALSIYSSAGGKYRALERAYTATVTDGVLNIAFVKSANSKNEPIVSAIEVRSNAIAVTPTPIPTATPTSTPTRTPTPTATPGVYDQAVNAGGVTYTDSLGRAWVADRAYTTGGWGYYLTGSSYAFSTAVSGTTDDLLYQRQRHDPGEYRFSVPNGTYLVTLRFAEFQANAASDRIMRITIEGAIVENALSIYGAAGRYVALDRNYTVTVNDGLLNIVFAQNGGAIAPIISAIRVQRQ